MIASIPTIAYVDAPKLFDRHLDTPTDKHPDNRKIAYFLFDIWRSIVK
jgi:hypothetical protein